MSAWIKECEFSLKWHGIERGYKIQGALASKLEWKDWGRKIEGQVTDNLLPQTHQGSNYIQYK